MSIKIRTFSNPVIAALLLLVLLNPLVTVSASGPAAPAQAVIKPVSIVTTRGSTLGAVASLRVADQSGTLDTPTKYVLFQTPGVATYQGYRTFTVPATVSPGAVSGMMIAVNYKGPLKSAQAWTWKLYDWVQGAWIKVGDNATVTSSTTWTQMQFNPTGDARRFINNATRQVRLQLLSSNALYDAKIDYEAIGLSYVPCSDALGCVLVPSGQALHIAYLLNMPVFETTNGVLLASEQAGTIAGHTIRLDGQSRTACDVAQSVADANLMVRDATIVAVIGTSCSSEAFQIMPVFSPAGFSMVSPSNTNPGLTDPGTPGYLRVSWNDNVQGELSAEYAASLGLTKAATISDGNAYGVGLIQSFASTFTTGGGTITAQKSISVGDKDMRAALSDIQSGGAQGIYMPVFMPEGAYIINQAGVVFGPPGTIRLMSSDSMYDKDVVLATGSDLQHFTITAQDPSQYSADYATFVTAYASRFSSTPAASGFAPYGYDAFNVIKAAIEDPTVALDVGGGAHLIGRQALRDALYATSGFAGLTGTITCQPDGDCAATPALAVFEYTPGVDSPSKVYP